jgi:uncharacterized protein (UPF0264 family)
MQLLVSVSDASEARTALLGGADVIDAKDPRRGSLGAVGRECLAAISATVAGRRPLSAALGDRASEALVERRALAAASQGAAFVKVGFRGVQAVGPARRIAAAAARGAGATTQVVLVAYADWRRAESVEPGALLALAGESGAAGVLLDTAFKDASLFDLLPATVVEDWVAAAHAAALFAALAGSLRGGDFSRARALGADLVGVRGAACRGGRAGPVALDRVVALSALARAAAAPAPAALV